MMTKITLAAAVTFLALAAAPSASVAQQLKPGCAGGGCIEGQNPDRAARPARMNNYKTTHHKKTKKPAVATTTAPAKNTAPCPTGQERSNRTGFCIPAHGDRG
jgi:hypothetical protein